MIRRLCRCPLSGASLASSLRRQSSVPERRNLSRFDSFMSGSSATFIDEMMAKWRADPNSVDPSWSEIFEGAQNKDRDAGLLEAELRPASTSKQKAFGVSQTLADCNRLLWLIQAFEDRGHLLASLDPLEFEADPTKRTPRRKFSDSLRLDLEFFGFTAADHDRLVHVGFLKDVGGILSAEGRPMTIKALHEHLMKTYCGNIGFEFSHISNDEIVRYLRDNVESADIAPNSPIHKPFSATERKEILTGIAKAVLFEDLLARKYSTKKRFGLDGGESFVVGLSALLERLSGHGVQEAIVGMAHRGRLSCLTHIFGKPLEALLKEFKGVTQKELEPYIIQSDVKYHLGSKVTTTFGKSKPISVELLANPSHLETVNPVVQGKVRASQVFRGDAKGTTVVPIEVHGDAAFAGQGITFETMGMSEIGEYHTGGTIHIVVNNQIGFTTDPKSSRSSAHCTDLGRIFHCPIFHVNGDRPEDVVRVFRLAADYRATFNRSVIVDLVCYRRNGHNESDVPSLTQPLLYNKIAAHPDILTLYGKHLINSGVVTDGEYNEIKTGIKKGLNATFDAVDREGFKYSEYLTACIPENWRSMAFSNGTPILEPTAVTKEALAPVVTSLNTTPSGFALHPTLAKILERRTAALVEGKGIEWGVAEALAIGTLLQEGVHVHLSGQDVERATFSQRHAVFHDQNTNATYTQLAHISKEQAKLTITNSSLSEYGVLGFEVGYSMHHPNALCMWEAQFGDFANGAQIIFDQYISAGETKWNTMYAPIVSLPHGFDGMGPEHSSGRLERCLQLVAEPEDMPALGEAERHHRNNLEVTFPTTPAQYFHLLRRHVNRNFRKPLINFFSKAYLREFAGANNTSTFDELTSGTFLPLIGDPDVPSAKAKRVVFCTGQIYHKLFAARAKAEITDVALVRIEQLAPFPVAEVQALLADYATQPLVWCQEEPQNMGAFWFVEPRFDHYCNGARTLAYAGRPPSASPATGYKYAHDYEQDLLIQSALQ